MSCEEGGLWSTTCATERLWVWVADSAYLMRGEEVSWLQSVSRGKEEEREVSNSHTLDSTTPAPVHTQGVKYHTTSQQHFRTLMSQLSCDWNLDSKPFTWIRVYIKVQLLCLNIFMFVVSTAAKIPYTTL